MQKTKQDYFVTRMDYVVSKTVEGKAILLNLNNGAYFGINAVGALVWKMCSGQRKKSAIVLAVSRKYRKEKGRVSREISQFIDELKHQRLVKMTPTAVRKTKRISG